MKRNFYVGTYIICVKKKLGHNGYIFIYLGTFCLKDLLLNLHSLSINKVLFILRNYFSRISYMRKYLIYLSVVRKNK